MYSSCYVFLSILSVAPRVVARSPSVHEDGESPPIPMVTLDHTLPVTSLQIWLADGRRLVQRFNLSHRWVWRESEPHFSSSELHRLDSAVSKSHNSMRSREKKSFKR